MIEEQEAEQRAAGVAVSSPQDRAGGGHPLAQALFRILSAGRRRWALLLGLVAFLVYARTLAISTIWGDSPELTAAAYNLGVPHPTGYPLYMLISHTFLRLFPFGSVAYRMNFLSAICAAGAVAFTFLVMLRFTRSRVAAGIATAMFAFSATFWSQAVIAEVYAFHMLLSTAMLGCVLAWDRRGEPRVLGAAALLYGLCLCHHGMSTLMAPGLLFFVLTSRYRGEFVRSLRWTLPLCLLPLSLYVYLPLVARGSNPMDWGDPRNWHNLIAHVTGQQYHVAMFHMNRPQRWDYVRNYLGLGLKHNAGFLRAQFTPGFFWLAPLGAWSLARRQRRLFGLTLLIYLADVIYALNYYIYDVEVYYLPSHLMVGIWLACGVRQIQVWLGRLWRRMTLPIPNRRSLNRALGASLLIMPLTLLGTNWSANDHHNDWGALMYARAALAHLKPHAILLGAGDNYYFPLLYVKFVEHRRPDVTMMSYNDIMRPSLVRLTTRLRAEDVVVRVPPSFGNMPQLAEDNRLLRAVIADNVDRRPLYVLGPPESLRLPWLSPVLAPYYRIVDSNVPTMELSRRGPPVAIAQARPRRPRHVRFGVRQPSGGVSNDLEFLGYEVDPARYGGVPWLRVSYYWRVNNEALARPAKVWVIFTNASGGFRRKADGSPEFHNIHPLAYGAGLGTQELPRLLRETFDIYVPPSEWGKTLHMRLAVALGETFLPTDRGRDPWLEMGALPIVGGAPPPIRVARAFPGVRPRSAPH